MSDTIQRLVGVYDADGSLRGELSYWVGKRIGRAHCALCDITHGLVRERGEWKQCRAELPVAFETFHRDDQPSEIRDVTAGRLPAVVAVTDAGPRLLLDADQLEQCAGSPSALIDAIATACQQDDLRWPELPG